MEPVSGAAGEVLKEVWGGTVVSDGASSKHLKSKSTHVDEPGVDCPEAEPVLLVCFGNLRVGVNHPTELDSREVGGQRETRAEKKREREQNQSQVGPPPARDASPEGKARPSPSL